MIYFGLRGFRGGFKPCGGVYAPFGIGAAGLSHRGQPSIKFNGRRMLQTRKP